MTSTLEQKLSSKPRANLDLEGNLLSANRGRAVGARGDLVAMTSDHPLVERGLFADQEGGVTTALGGAYLDREFHH